MSVDNELERLIAAIGPVQHRIPMGYAESRYQAGPVRQLRKLVRVRSSSPILLVCEVADEMNEWGATRCEVTLKVGKPWMPAETYEEFVRGMHRATEEQLRRTAAHRG